MSIFAGVTKLRAYWASVFASTWFANHILKNDIMECPDMFVPVFLHGDDAPVTQESSGLVVSIRSPLAWGKPALDS
eukprot:4238334-Lingulodinium_polyedra.AAC.1